MGIAGCWGGSARVPRGPEQTRRPLRCTEQDFENWVDCGIFLSFLQVWLSLELRALPLGWWEPREGGGEVLECVRGWVVVNFALVVRVGREEEMGSLGFVFAAGCCCSPPPDDAPGLNGSRELVFEWRLL